MRRQGITRTSHFTPKSVVGKSEALWQTPHRSADQWGALSPPIEKASDRYPVRRQRRFYPGKLSSQTGALENQQLLVANAVSVAR